MTCILWSSDFASYLKDYLMEKCCTWDNRSMWLKDQPCKIYVGQWPIFHGPLILPYIIVIDSNYFYTLRKKRAGRGYSCPSGHLLKFYQFYTKMCTFSIKKFSVQHLSATSSCHAWGRFTPPHVRRKYPEWVKIVENLVGYARNCRPWSFRSSLISRSALFAQTYLSQ